MTSTHIIAGVMSGTSLDGLDIAICSFSENENRWNFEISGAVTVNYPDEWKHRLSRAHLASGMNLIRLHYEFGHFTGQQVKNFCLQHQFHPVLIGSHGHTVFHLPEERITYQIGNGAAIAYASGIDTVCDFRSSDVVSGGQGAPLVPIGDQLLFGGHKFCLNLGGFANISYENKHKRIAFDICPVNIALNFLSELNGKEFDDNGAMAMRGDINTPLLDKLNSLPFYESNAPKSLGREWFENSFLKLISDDTISVEDRLRTVCEHIGFQISKVLFHQPGTTMLTTGGGALNGFLVELIEEHVSRHGIHVVVPANNIVQYKEALIFGFLGLLRYQNRINILSSVTGGSKDSSGGCIYKA